MVVNTIAHAHAHATASAEAYANADATANTNVNAYANTNTAADLTMTTAINPSYFRHRRLLPATATLSPLLLCLSLVAWTFLVIAVLAAFSFCWLLRQNHPPDRHVCRRGTAASPRSAARWMKCESRRRRRP